MNLPGFFDLGCRYDRSDAKPDPLIAINRWAREDSRAFDAVLDESNTARRRAVLQ